jgi:hypothetical protein
VRVKMAAVHTDLLANGSVVHEAKVRSSEFVITCFSAKGGYLPANDGGCSTSMESPARREGTIGQMRWDDSLIACATCALWPPRGFPPRIIFVR